MTIVLDDPPVVKRGEDFVNDKFENNIHFYLAYEHLPLRNISIIMKTVNELYELTYLLLNDEKVPSQYKLKLNFAETGNSFDWIGTLIEELKPSKKALIALSIATAIIYTPIGIEKYKGNVAQRHYTEMIIEKTEAEIEKTKAEVERIKAETKKIQSEKECIDLENLLKKNQIKQDSIDRINQEKNRKKILRKKKSIDNAINHRAIYYCTINNNIIVDKK